MKLILWALAAAVLTLTTPAIASYTDVSFNFIERPSTDADTLVVLVPEDTDSIELEGWSQQTIQHVNRAVSAAEFSASAGEQIEVLAPAGLSVERLVLIGMDDPTEFSRTDAENAGAELAAHVNGTAAEVIRIDSTLLVDEELNKAHVARLAHGVQLRNYRFDRFKSEPDSRPAQTYDWQVLDADSVETAFRHYYALAQGVFWARELTNLPGSSGYPEAFTRYASELEEYGLEVTILGPEEVKDMGMGALYGVSQGSQHKSHMLTVQWAGSDDAPIALVGKGNTFDTGGYNLKTNSASILRMHTDKAGAAAVVGAVKALAIEEAPINVVAVAPLTHNLISDKAQLPGDVVTTGAGKTIEVANTDAEGRLALTDGIWYARETFSPRAIVDIATLTGAKVGALGSHYAGLFSDDDAILATLQEAGETTGEKVWRLPMGPEHEATIQSRIADFRNVGSPGATAGAVLLQQFAGDTPWAHLDIAGDALVDSDQGIHPRGATGHGVRLLTEWVKLYHAQH